MSPRPTASEDRLFVREPFRHYRRTYSTAEVRWGLVVLVLLVAIAAWVAWEGARGDPDLFASSQPGKAMALPGDQAAATESGPLSADLAPQGWSAGEVSTFGPENLYVKINGRADYFLSYGFKRLYFMTLRASQDDDAPVIDIEAYDLGEPSNALGAFSGEEKDGEPTNADGGLVYLSANALFVARDRYYVRAIGSEGSAEIRAALEHLRGAFESAIGGGDGERPWAYELFSEKLDIPVDQIRYAAENALSFEFATDVYSAVAGGDVQVFASLRASEAEAAELAEKIRDGFASLGTAGDGGWVTDKFLGTFATAVAEGRYVIGVRGAPDREAGERHLARLREALPASGGPDE